MIIKVDSPRFLKAVNEITPRGIERIYYRWKPDGTVLKLTPRGFIPDATYEGFIGGLPQKEIIIIERDDPDLKEQLVYLCNSAEVAQQGYAYICKVLGVETE